MWPFNKKACVDQVWVQKGTTYCLFSATGRTGELVRISEVSGGASTIRITEKDADFAVMCDDKVIEVFANRDTAKQAFDSICLALKGQSVFRWRRPALLFGLSLLAFFLLASLGNKPPQESYQVGAVPPVAAPLPGDYDAILREANGGRMPASTPLPGMGGPEKINLKEIEGLNFVNIGKGRPALYVFSDPACPSCKELHQLLTDKKISYAAIPVAVLGEDSALRAARVMCAKDRSAAWTTELTGGTAALETSDRKSLAACAQKVIDNMNTFRRLGFNATPSIISASTGRVGIPQTPEELDELTKGKK